MAIVRHSLIAVLSALALAVPLSRSAQSSPQDSPPQNPSDRAARLSFVDGTVSVLPTGASDWSQGFLNRPLGTGDHLWSDNASRAEIDAGDAALRLSSNSEVSLLELSTQGLQLGVGVGTINVAVHSANTSEWFEIDTPEVAMSLQRNGDYRVTVDLDGSTTVLVRTGLAHLNNKSGEGISLRDGQGVVFASDGTLDVADARLADSFDRWCAQRDVQWQRESAQASYVPADVPGADQLNDSGQWSDQPDFGPVWFPTVIPIGWAPFKSGRWCWTNQWGWTWVDRQSWGYAPFHYGRWVNLNGRWGWVPPASNLHPNFAAALVSAPAGITTEAPTIGRPSHANGPPVSVTHRTIVATRTPTAGLVAGTGSAQHIVMAAAAPAVASSTPAYVSPIGPTIYARDVHIDSTFAPHAPALHDQLVEPASRTPVAHEAHVPSPTRSVAEAPVNPPSYRPIQHAPVNPMPGKAGVKPSTPSASSRGESRSPPAPSAHNFSTH